MSKEVEQKLPPLGDTLMGMLGERAKAQLEESRFKEALEKSVEAGVEVEFYTTKPAQ